MAKARRRKVPTPSTAWADRLEDAADYTARYDVPVDWADGRSSTTEKLIRSAGMLRYWKAGPLFRRRMLRSVLGAVVIVGALFALDALLPRLLN